MYTGNLVALGSPVRTASVASLRSARLKFYRSANICQIFGTLRRIYLLADRDAGGTAERSLDGSFYKNRNGVLAPHRKNLGATQKCEIFKNHIQSRTTFLACPHNDSDLYHVVAPSFLRSASPYTSLRPIIEFCYGGLNLAKKSKKLKSKSGEFVDFYFDYLGAPLWVTS